MAGGVNKIDSNVTGLSYAEEACIGLLEEELSPPGPGTTVWKQLEPNTYSDFGAQTITTKREPIDPSRQLKKGVVTDFDAGGGTNQDLTQTNTQDIMQGFMFADFRPKVEFGGAGEITGVVTATDDYQAASGLDAYQVGSLIFVSKMGQPSNNGLKTVNAASGIALTVDENLVDETPPADAKIVEVGIIGAAGDIDVDVTGTYPALSSTVLDFTTLNLNPGETIFIGGDSAAFGFANAVNNGWKRIRSISANLLTLDKSDSLMVTEGSSTETIQIFFGRVLKNESLPINQVRRTYNLERQLGAPDPDQPAEIQAEVLIGAVPAEITLNAPTAEKLTVDLAFVALNNLLIDGPTDLKVGTREVLEEGDAFNTSNDFTRAKLGIITGDEVSTPLVAFMTDLAISINNNISVDKALGVTGGFDATAGNFTVNGNITAYFTDTATITAVKNNADVTLELAFVKNNAGISIDLPLIALGDGRLDVVKDESIKIPVTLDAATGKGLDLGLDHTLMMVFYDYLPDAADPVA